MYVYRSIRNTRKWCSRNKILNNKSNRDFQMSSNTFFFDNKSRLYMQTCYNMRKFTGTDMSIAIRKKQRLKHKARRIDLRVVACIVYCSESKFVEQHWFTNQNYFYHTLQLSLPELFCQLRGDLLMAAILIKTRQSTSYIINN